MDREQLIEKESRLLRKLLYTDFTRFLESEEFLEARYYFLYYAPAKNWKEDFYHFMSDIDGLYEKANNELRTEYLKLLVFMAIDLKSYAVKWVLAQEHDAAIIEKAHKTILAKTLEIAEKDPQTASHTHQYFTQITAGKLAAEDVPPENIEIEALKVCGKSLDVFIGNTIQNIQSSGIPGLKSEDQNSAMITGNDYGEYLNDTIWLGISYTTTNPPLVNMVWDIDVNAWKSKLNDAVEKERDFYLAGNDSLANLCCLATLVVVEKNCRLLRGIFYTTRGSEGYACYQVNPENHDNAENMISEVRDVYELLKKRLKGIPNVSFKLPGTSAGLKAAKVLSSEGQSLTITLEFGLFQALAFAKVFEKGSAITSNLVIMNGRLAFPVRDELLAAGIEGAEEAAQWAGIEATRKLYRRLYNRPSKGGLGLDTKKIRIMNASLRIYGNQIPDIAELTGPQVMTIFPNVRRAWDSIRRNCVYGKIEHETPEKYLNILKKSEIFCQAWWTAEDGIDGKPDTVLSSNEADKEQVEKWVPVKATLDQFLSAYDKLRNQVKLIG